ncbi:MAG TPA: sigma factor-like helix-turn-helix DNA-binding protein [Gemmatimonas sp.]|uniref:sigma factor-like helix-turn-helix DNA-binding protein n=1 Tax=Gemmatimonas sp. TaxID=1962908 RepID=UPI002ED9896D
MTSDPAPTTPSDTESDIACLQAIAGGDEHALRRLYDRHGATVYGLVLRILGDPEKAAQATADTFKQTWRDAGRYRGVRGSVLGWVTTIARLRALEMARADHDARHDVLSDGTSPLVVALPEETQQAITLIFFGGLTQYEVADRLRIPTGTVRRHVEMGMRALRVKREAP